MQVINICLIKYQAKVNNLHTYFSISSIVATCMAALKTISFNSQIKLIFKNCFGHYCCKIFTFIVRKSWRMSCGGWHIAMGVACVVLYCRCRCSLLCVVFAIA